MVKLDFQGYNQLVARCLEKIQGREFSNNRNNLYVIVNMNMVKYYNILIESNKMAKH